MGYIISIRTKEGNRIEVIQTFEILEYANEKLMNKLHDKKILGFYIGEEAIQT